MKAALISLAILLALGWLETVVSWNWYSRPRGRWGELEWRLVLLAGFTAVFAVGAWRYLSA